MIQTSLTFNSKPIDDLIGFLDSYAKVVYEEFQAAYDVVEPLMLKELEVEPQSAVYPIQWTSDKQRKFVMAKLREENNLPYNRTGKLAKAWQVNKVGSGLSFTVKVLNPSSASPFVYGSLSITNRGAYKQAFHSNTGWQTAGSTIDFWLEALTELFIQNMSDRLGDVVGSTKTQRRSYTNTRPKPA